jgi:hypothetical protein
VLGRVGRGVELVLDGGEGTEKQIGGVSHDGGAPRGDLIPGLELIEVSKGMVDGDSGAEFLGVTDEGCSEVRLVEVFLAPGGVFGAEAGSGVGDGQTATAAAGSTLLKVEQNRVGTGAGARDLRIHVSSFPT